MGCKSSHEESNEDHFRRLNLPEPDATAYQSEFEKDAFITISLIRADPKSMAKHFKAFKNHRMYTGQRIAPLVNQLMTMDPLPNVTLDCNACKACRMNTTKK